MNSPIILLYCLKSVKVYQLNIIPTQIFQQDGRPVVLFQNTTVMLPPIWNSLEKDI